MTGKDIDYGDILRRWKCTKVQAANDLERLLLRDELPSPGSVARAIVTLRENAEPTRHGHWIFRQWHRDGRGSWYCSECGFKPTFAGPYKNGMSCVGEGKKYCGCCGAKMDEVGDEPDPDTV